MVGKVLPIKASSLAAVLALASVAMVPVQADEGSTAAPEQPDQCSLDAYASVLQADKYEIAAGHTVTLSEDTAIIADDVVVLGILRGANATTAGAPGVSICIEAKNLTLHGTIAGGDGFSPGHYFVASDGATVEPVSGTVGGTVQLWFDHATVLPGGATVVRSGSGGGGQDITMFDHTLTGFGFCASQLDSRLMVEGGRGGDTGDLVMSGVNAELLSSLGVRLELGFGGVGGDATALFGTFAGADAVGGDGGNSGNPMHPLGQWLTLSSGGAGGDAVAVPCLDADTIGLGTGFPDTFATPKSTLECEEILENLGRLNVAVPEDPCTVEECEGDCEIAIPSCEEIRQSVPLEAGLGMNPCGDLNPCEGKDCTPCDRGSCDVDPCEDGSCDVDPCEDGRCDVDPCGDDPQFCENPITVPCTEPGAQPVDCIVARVIEECYKPRLNLDAAGVPDGYPTSICGVVDSLIDGRLAGTPGASHTAEGDSGTAGNTGQEGGDAGWSYVDGNSGISVGAGSGGAGASVSLCTAHSAGDGENPQQAPQEGASASAGGGKGGPAYGKGGPGGNAHAVGGTGGVGGAGGSGGNGIRAVPCGILILKGGGDGAPGDTGGVGGTGSAAGGDGGDAQLLGGDGGSATGEGSTGGAGGAGGNGGGVDDHWTCWGNPSASAQCGGAKALGNPKDGYAACGGTGGGGRSTTLERGQGGSGLADGTDGEGAGAKGGSNGAYGSPGTTGRTRECHTNFLLDWLNSL